MDIFWAFRDSLEWSHSILPLLLYYVLAAFLNIAYTSVQEFVECSIVLNRDIWY
jgi:hypothetical protein